MFLNTLFILPSLCLATNLAATSFADGAKTNQRSLTATAATPEYAAYDDKSVPVCDNPCGCDRSVYGAEGYYYNETSGNCELSPNVKNIMVEQYNSEEKIRVEANRVFAGVIGSAILVVSFVLVMGFVACFYCCCMNYSDHKLEGDVQALARRRGRNINPPPARPKPRYRPVAESCSVLVGDTGVCVM